MAFLFIFPSYCLLQFMMDVSNRFQVASASVLFLEVLSDDRLQKVPVLLILNKK